MPYYYTYSTALLLSLPLLCLCYLCIKIDRAGIIVSSSTLIPVQYSSDLVATWCSNTILGISGETALEGVSRT
jgi:hypothetical protein